MCGRLDIEGVFFEANGILQYKGSAATGEKYLLSNILPDVLNKDRPIICDVGANIGDYTAEVLLYHPEAIIFAFEPHPMSFKKLSDRFSASPTQARLHNIGLGSCREELPVFDYAEREGSTHASLYRGVLEQVHKERKIATRTVCITTLDQFALENGLEEIDLLKIDTEGHELEVLKGATRLLSKGAISLVQFEFNEMNVVSRVFIKDFFDLLIEFDFYRLARGRLIPLGDYNSRYEIFKFQNILAVNSRFGPVK
jgi:FkbM family methyltransferase